MQGPFRLSVASCLRFFHYLMLVTDVWSYKLRIICFGDFAMVATRFEVEKFDRKNGFEL